MNFVSSTINPLNKKSAINVTDHSPTSSWNSSTVWIEKRITSLHLISHLILGNRIKISTRSQYKIASPSNNLKSFQTTWWIRAISKDTFRERLLETQEIHSSQDKREIRWTKAIRMAASFKILQVKKETFTPLRMSTWSIVHLKWKWIARISLSMKETDQESQLSSWRIRTTTAVTTQTCCQISPISTKKDDDQFTALSLYYHLLKIISICPITSENCCSRLCRKSWINICWRVLNLYITSFLLFYHNNIIKVRNENSYHNCCYPLLPSTSPSHGSSYSLQLDKVLYQVGYKNHFWKITSASPRSHSSPCLLSHMYDFIYVDEFVSQ